MKTVLTSAACSLSLLFAASSHAQTAVEKLQQLKAEAQSGPASKLASSLLALKDRPRRIGVVRARTATSPYDQAMGIHDGHVLVTAYGPDPASLRSELEAKGLIDARTHATSVSGRAPVERIAEMAELNGLTYMKQSFPVTNAGLVTSQGDVSMYSDLARQQFGVDGTGVRVGVISDSYDCAPGATNPELPFTTAEEDIANGDLPIDVHILSDADNCKQDEHIKDEGRAMMQIVHDVAPGAPLSFYSGVNSAEDFAEGILKLAADGARVIVDDLSYMDTPVFENGVIAKAVNTVKQQGVTYFSSAGNRARQSYASTFRPAARGGANGTEHDFDPGEGVDTRQYVTIEGDLVGVVYLSWDEPSLSANGIKGSASDLDVVFYDMNGQPVPVCKVDGEDDGEDEEIKYCQVPGIANNLGNDALDWAGVLNFDPWGSPLHLQIGIELRSGPAPTRIQYQHEGLNIREYDTQSSTIFGHANAEGAEAVGGAWWFDTAAFGAANHPMCNFACVNSYSAAGGIPLIFDDRGERRSKPYIGFKPGVTGPDAGNTTFFNTVAKNAPGEPDGFPNFFGTSAAAPHVAAVAALMLDQRARDIAAGKRFDGPKELSPDAIVSALRRSADDIKHRALDDAPKTQPIRNGEGFDFDSGFGMVNALKALELTKGH